MNGFHDFAPSVGKNEQQEVHMRINIGLILWIITTIASTIWIACGNPDMNFLACLFWGGFLGMITTGTLISAYGQIWIGWHTPEIIDEVCDGLLGNGRRGRK